VFTQQSADNGTTKLVWEDIVVYEFETKNDPGYENDITRRLVTNHGGENAASKSPNSRM
jgi:hypothetical protein